MNSRMALLRPVLMLLHGTRDHLLVGVRLVQLPVLNESDIPNMSDMSAITTLFVLDCSSNAPKL